MLGWIRKRRTRALQSSAEKYLFQYNGQDLSLSSGLQFLSVHGWASRSEMCRAFELAACQVTHREPDPSIEAFYGNISKKIQSREHIQDSLEIAGLRAERAILRAQIELDLRRLAPDYSQVGIIYRAEKEKGARLTEKQRSELMTLAAELERVEKKLS